MAVTEDVAANEAVLLRFIALAREEGARILLTPEGSLSGYTPWFDRSLVAAALGRVTAAAQDAGIGLALGTCFEESDGRCRNEVRMYTPGGEYLGHHAKTLTCGTLTDDPDGEIRHYAVDALRTFEFQGVRVGALICNDLWANPGCTPQYDPHLTHQLAKMGARVVFHAVNGGRNGSPMSELAWQYHESNLRMRAIASRIWIVTVDNCAPECWPCSAPSGVIGPDGQWLVRAEPQGEQLFVWTIDGL